MALWFKEGEAVRRNVYWDGKHNKWNEFEFDWVHLRSFHTNAFGKGVYLFLHPTSKCQNKAF